MQLEVPKVPETKGHVVEKNMYDAVSSSVVVIPTIIVFAGGNIVL